MKGQILRSCVAALLLTLMGAGHALAGDIKTVAVTGAPKAGGPYSQGVIANGFLFTAGILARDPATNNFVEGDMVVQATRVFDSLEAIVKGAGASLKDVVKVTVYMTDLADFAKMNDVMVAKFGDHKPARSTVQVAKLAGTATLEVDFIAVVPK